MQTFNTFFRIAKKRMISNIIYLVIYLVVTLLLTGIGAGGASDQFSATSLTIAVEDMDQSASSEALIRFLDTIHEIREMPESTNALSDELYYRSTEYALIIPKGFEERLLAGETKELLSDVKIPGSAAGFFADQQIEEYISSIQLNLISGNSIENAIRMTDEAIASKPEIKMISFEQGKSVKKTKLFSFFQFLPYIFSVMLIVGMSPILSVFRTNPLARRIACSSTPNYRRNVGIIFGCFFYSLAAWFVFMLIAFLIYGTTLFSREGFLGMGNSLLSVFFATGLAFLVSNITADDSVLNMIGNIYGLSSAFLCGCFVPQSLLADKVLAVAKFLPSYWYVRANNMIGGMGSEAFSEQLFRTCIDVQLLFVVAIFAVGFMVSRQKRA